MPTEGQDRHSNVRWGTQVLAQVGATMHSEFYGPTSTTYYFKCSTNSSQLWYCFKCFTLQLPVAPTPQPPPPPQDVLQEQTQEEDSQEEETTEEEVVEEELQEEGEGPPEGEEGEGPPEGEEVKVLHKRRRGPPEVPMENH